MKEPTIYYNGIPVIKNELINFGTILIVYKYDGKSSKEIIQMKKDKNIKDVAMILYNIENEDNIKLFNKVSSVI